MLAETETRLEKSTEEVEDLKKQLAEAGSGGGGALDDSEVFKLFDKTYAEWREYVDTGLDLTDKLSRTVPEFVDTVDEAKGEDGLKEVQEALFGLDLEEDILAVADTLDGMDKDLETIGGKLDTFRA